MNPYLRIVHADEEIPPQPAVPALSMKYEPDRFQKFAIAAIEAGENVLITAKTGSGKTFVGEYQIAKSLSRGRRVFYTTPIKSLSNQKFHDLKQLFPDASVGIMTGDIKFNPDAQILVMTTEILRNLLYKRGTATEHVGLTSILSMENLDAVIFDEVHYINDPDRGHVWEECLMLLPPEIHMILLSATLAGAETFAGWIASLKQVRLWLISTQWRAVPLYHYVLGGNGELRVLQDKKEVYSDSVYREWLEEQKKGILAADAYKQKVKDARRGGVEGAIEGKVHVKSFEYKLNNCLTMLFEKNLLPCLVFVFSRAGCEQLAARVEGDFLDSSESAAVAHIWDFHLSRFRDSLVTLQQYHTLRTLAMRGIAFHHSGLVPFLKEILEILFSKGLVRVLFATETFAVGINMPTKTVLFTGLEKYDDTRGGHRVLRSDEYIQMAGRAGRRGKDDKGIVLYVPQREPIQPWDMKGMMTGGAARVHSRLSFQYEFILKTFQNSNLSWENLLEKSYWFALLEQERAAAARSVAAAEAAVAAVYLTNDEMEACEQWNEIDKRLAVSVNAKKKAAQKDLARWEEDHSEKHWETTLAKWKHRQQKEQELAFERRNAAELGVGGVDSRAGHEIVARLRILAECGYVKGDVGDSQQEETLESSATILKPPPSKGWVLCEKGRLATEVNEGHPLLIPEIFLSGSLEPLPIVEQLSILAIFLGEPRADDENHIPVEELPLSNKGQEIVRGLQRNASAWMDLEKKEGGCVDYRYWSMSYEWVEPISKWLQGMSLSEICGMYGLFEGNLQRAILKLANLAEEWMALATLTQRVEVLRVWESARTLILRDIVIAESLYLRL